MNLLKMPGIRCTERKMKVLLRHKGIALLATLSWMGVIFYLSHQPAEASSELSGRFAKLVMGLLSLLPITFDGEVLHFFIRKGAHFFAYMVLGFLMYHSVRLFSERKPIENVLFALILSVIYAMTDEWHQTFIPGRSGELRDVLIDSVGSLTGILIYYWILRLLYNKKDKDYM